jgi:hypothetical protein
VTDGTSFWVVDGSKLKVFKYTLSGSLLGSWVIDPANTHPTGITINPNNVCDVWIVDSGTLKVYQYVGAATRTSGSQAAAATFALAPGDTNLVGIADPPPHMLLTPAPAAARLGLPAGAGANAATFSGVLPVAAVHSPSGPAGVFAPSFPAALSSGPSAVAGVASLASRDALFALLVRESLLGPDVSCVDLTGGAAPTPNLDYPTPDADAALTLTGISYGQQPLDGVTPFAPENQQPFGSDGGAVGLLDRVWSDDASQPSAITTDAFAAILAENAPTEE